jgi:hypothetical protein
MSIRGALGAALPVTAAILLAGSLLASGGASAKIVRDAKVQDDLAETGGVPVQGPTGKAQVQCWQYGTRIIDASDLALNSVGVGTQAGAITFAQPGSRRANAAILSQNRTTCMVMEPD